MRSIKFPSGSGKERCWKSSVWAVILFLGFFSWVSSGFAEEPISLEERVLRMEQQLRDLQQTNEELKQEVRSLQEQLRETGVEAPLAVTNSSSPAATGTAPESGVGHKKGFFIESGSGDFALNFGGRVTTRYTGFLSDSPLFDEFSVERARLETDVSLLDYYSLRVQVEFADSPKLKDGYIDVHYIPEARVRLGQFKVPFSWEGLQSHKYLDFADRSFAVTNMRASRDIGAMLHGELWEDYLQYQLAVVNGSGENTGENNSSKDVIGRVVLQPFCRSDNEMLSLMLLGLSGAFGNEDANFSDTSFKTIAGTEFVDFTNGTYLRGDRSQLGAEFIWPFGPASIKSELMWMSMEDLENNGVKEDARFLGWYLSGTYLLTGEKKTTGRLIPHSQFDPFRKTWGAWEIAARYSLFESEDDLFEQGLATGTDRAESFTVGLNWYLNPFMRMIVDYEHTEFDNEFVFKDETVDEEDVLLVQWQLEF